MRPRRIRKLLSTALALVILGTTWFYLAPTQVGGSASYVVTHGTSMEPRFHTGDLAIVRSQSSYHVGEVVAYHNHQLHTIVLHRIIGREGDKYIFKGDNNDFVDPEHPLASQLIGSLWIHIPGAGVRLQSIRSPAVMGGLIFVGILLLFGGAFTQRRRQRHRQRRAGGSIMDSSPHLPRRPGAPVVAVLTIGLLALLPFLVLALLAFTRPLTTSRVVNIPYKQSGKLSYSADQAPGPAYPAGRASTGEPLFTNVLPAVGVRFDYRFESASKHTVAGKASLSAKITSTSGWHTTLALGAPTYFRGDHALVTGTLDLGSLVALMQSVETTTKVRGTYAFTITPHVNADGRVGQTPLKATFAPEIKFSVVEGEIKPEGTAESPGAIGSAGKASSSSSGSSASNQFAPSSSGSVTGSQQEPTALPLGIVRPSDATMRAVALGAIAIILGVLLATLALLRANAARFAPRQRDEGASILARYRHLIVPVARVWPLPGVPVIDVSDIDALVRIAEHYERSILYEAPPEGESFWVTDESGQFRYTVAGTSATDAVVTSSWAAEDAPAPSSVPATAAAQATPAAPAEVVPDPSTLSHDLAPAAADWSQVPAPVYADELELGGVFDSSTGQPTDDLAIDPAADSGQAAEHWALPADADTFVQEGVDRRRTDEDVDVSLWRRSGEAGDGSPWRRTDDDSDVSLWRQARPDSDVSLRRESDEDSDVSMWRRTGEQADTSPEPAATSAAYFTGLEWTTNS
jgi:signal peptidase I